MGWPTSVKCGSLGSKGGDTLLKGPSRCPPEGDSLVLLRDTIIASRIRRCEFVGTAVAGKVEFEKSK